MNNSKIHIIHPKDESTDFLDSITEYIEKYTSVEINLLRLQTKKDHFIFFELIQSINDDELILFFGHGTSKGLSGSVTKDFEQREFITEKQLKIFENKNIVILSCRSNQYLNSYFKECNLKSAIGFPNLITDYEEIEYHDDPKRVENLKQEDIDIFRKMIVDIIKFSLEDYINHNLSIQQLYNRIKLRINKKVINLYFETPNRGKLPLGKILNDMASDLKYFYRIE